MNFSRPKRNIIESDDGFAVETFGRSSIRYTERGRSLIVGAESQLGDRPFAVYWDYIKTEIPGVDEDLAKRNGCGSLRISELLFVLTDMKLTFFHRRLQKNGGHPIPVG